jgi:type I restriction enzyme S subunit
MNDLVETEIGHLPATWQVQRLSEVFETQLGKMLSQKARIGNAPKPYLRNKNVQWGRVDVSDMLYMDFDERETEKFRLRAGDLLVCEGGEPGRSAIWNGALTECFYQKALHRLRPRDGRMLSEFLNYWLRFSFELQNLYGVAGASSTIAHLPEVQLKALPIPVPPVAEQREIAAVLGLVQRAIEQQERMVALTAELKKVLLHKLFTEGLRGEPQKQTEIGPVPESWEVVAVNDCCTVQTGVAKGRKVDEKEALTLPYLRVANVQSGYLDLSEMKTVTIRTKEKGRYLLQKGDIVLTEGGDFDKLGRGFIWKGEVEDCIHQNHIFAVRVNRSRLLPEFFAHLSQSAYGKAYFLSVAHKTTNLACINTTKLKGFPVLIPTKAEQEEIVQILESVDYKLVNHARKKRLLEDLFRTSLHQLMTAQIRLHDLDLPELEICLKG